MTAHPPLVKSLKRASLALCLMAACRGDSTAPVAAAVVEREPPSQANADPKATPEPPDAGRDLWFADGPGRLAILARERGDHAAAVLHLDALLATELNVDDRGAASLLRGLEHLSADEYEQAAKAFAVARQAPLLAPINLRLTLLEAQARLDAGQPDVALTLLEALPQKAVDDSPLVADIHIAWADALVRQDQPEQAQTRYRKVLRKLPDGRRRFEVMAKLADSLASSNEPKDNAEATELYEALLMKSPLSDYGERATQAVDIVRKRAGITRSVDERRAFDEDVALARVQALLHRRRYAATIKEADALLRRASLADAQRCRLLYAKGSARFKQRDRKGARPVFERASTVCAKAGKSYRSLEVKSRYQAARGFYAEGRYSQAAQAFEGLATDHADHSYADDAWLLAGESWTTKGDDAKATAALRKAVDKDGDMREEARRRLLLMLFTANESKDVIELCQTGLSRPGLHPHDRAKLVYFTGRAKAKLGDLEGARAAWLEVLEADPLHYVGLQALSRLRELGPEASAAALAILQANSGSTEQRVDAVQSAPKAVLLAKLGLGTEARDELRHAEVGGWPAVAVLDQAGLYPQGQRLLANMSRKWREVPPGPSNRYQWELAHPRPFAAIVKQYERDLVVPHLLAFAVMQTESRFDPNVTSWAGARGLIQLMPATARHVARKADKRVKPEQLFDPATNLDLGMRYLSGLVELRGGGDAAVALAVPSYNAGPGAVSRWLDERGDWDLDLFIESIPYDETRKYTQSVLGRWWAYRWIYSEGRSLEPAPMLPLAIPQPEDTAGEPP